MLTMIQPAASQQTTGFDVFDELEQLSSAMKITTQKLGSLGQTEVATGATGALGEMMTELRLRLSTLDSIGADMTTQQAQLANLSERIPTMFFASMTRARVAEEILKEQQIEYDASFFLLFPLL